MPDGLRLMLAVAGGGVAIPVTAPPPPSGGGGGGSGGGSSGSTPTVTDEFSGTTLAALQTFLDGVADGSVVGLPASSTITGTGKIHLDGRALSIVGRNAVLKRTTAGTDQILLLDGGGGPYGLYDLIIEGSKSSALGKWDVDFENEHGIALGGVVGFEAARCTVRHVGGDGFYLSGGNNIWSKNGRIHHGTFYDCGRMSVTITDGARNFTIDYNNFSQCGYYCWDIEPNGATVEGIAAGALDIVYANNTIGTKPYGDNPDDTSQATGYMLAITGASGTGPAKRITVRDNIITGGAMRVGVFNNGVDVEDFVMTGNSSSQPFSAGTLSHCVSVDGCVNVTVSGNTQPCPTDADFITTSGSSGTIVTSPNTI